MTATCVTTCPQLALDSTFRNVPGQVQTYSSRVNIFPLLITPPPPLPCVYPTPTFLLSKSHPEGTEGSSWTLPCYSHFGSSHRGGWRRRHRAWDHIPAAGRTTLGQVFTCMLACLGSSHPGGHISALHPELLFYFQCSNPSGTVSVRGWELL